ncbi:CvpA family protein [Bacillus marinisedimentorum]|uniref:CvpA family protein n=1 Tax=Bacillus marinisedimentorum TaxID=1821260 RepID=UPI0008733FC1|nr:CvpA family protein [Bacillus marinisedimentorum]
MLDLILLIVLISGFVVGLRRGFILQLVYLTGFIVAFVVAYLYFDDLAPHLKLWVPYPALPEGSSMQLFLDNIHIEAAYYRAIAFAVLFFGTKIIMHIIGAMFDFLADLPVLRTFNGWLGGALGFIEVYLIAFILLYLAAFMQVEFIQQALGDSILAQVIVEHTPGLSRLITNLWVEHIATLLR